MDHAGSSPAGHSIHQSPLIFKEVNTGRTEGHELLYPAAWTCWPRRRALPAPGSGNR